MIGNRLKLLRQANCLSLQELSDLLVGSGLEIKRAALSHYELGITQPTASALEILARKLGTTPDFFYMDDWTDLHFHVYHTLDISPKLETALYSFLQIELEKLLYIEQLLDVNCQIPTIEPMLLSRSQEEETETLARHFRELYGLGDAPISGVCSMLETNGWHIIELPEIFKTDCIAGQETSKNASFILHEPLYVIDDFRTSLLKGVGYSCLKGEDESHTQILTDRFARAVLFPRESVYREFGTTREDISLEELSFMKQKYGVSKRNIMARLEELHVITKPYYDSFEDLMRLHGYPRRKRIMSETLMFYENSTLPAMRILEAYSRKLISSEVVNQLLLLKSIT